MITLPDHTMRKILNVNPLSAKNASIQLTVKSGLNTNLLMKALLNRFNKNKKGGLYWNLNM